MQTLTCSCCELSRLQLDHRDRGTRFRLFPQSPLVTGYQTPETVWLSLHPGGIGPGPSDDRMYVIDAIGKDPYQFPYLPPYAGPAHAPATAGPEGHFDHLQVGTHAFEAAHIYGVTRFVLDIWETYFGRRVEWNFAADYAQLELVPWLDWNNAHCGYGFIETGYRVDDAGRKFPLNLNFDVLAHEFGHALLYSVIGMPEQEEAGVEFMVFHETGGDILAIVSLLHFDTVVDRLLHESSGNLYASNELNRLGEESNTRQIRMASNDLTLDDVPGMATKGLTIKQIHDISLPFTGALFDLLVELFQQNLVEEGLIDAQLDRLSRGAAARHGEAGLIQQAFDAAYRQAPVEFKRALVEARDYLGLMLAWVWEGLSWNLTWRQVVRACLEADQALSGGYYQAEIQEVFQKRRIIRKWPEMTLA